MTLYCHYCNDVLHFEIYNYVKNKIYRHTDSIDEFTYIGPILHFIVVIHSYYLVITFRDAIQINIGQAVTGARTGDLRRLQSIGCKFHFTISI